MRAIDLTASAETPTWRDSSLSCSHLRLVGFGSCITVEGVIIQGQWLFSVKADPKLIHSCTMANIVLSRISITDRLASKLGNLAVYEHTWLCEVVSRSNWRRTRRQVKASLRRNCSAVISGRQKNQGKGKARVSHAFLRTVHFKSKLNAGQTVHT